MPYTFGERLKHAWNAFNDKSYQYQQTIGVGYGSRPDVPRLTMGAEKSIISSVYTRIGLDVCSIPIQHIRIDQNGRFLEVINSGLNNCLTVEANLDQSGKDFIRDVVLSMFDEGCVAIVPVDTTINPIVSGSFDVQTMRTGRIVEWYPAHVRVNVYNEKRGMKEEIVLPKNTVAIIENPLYPVMNEQGSIIKRLISKLNLLDAIDTESGSGKLDIIIQLPYVVKSTARKAQAEARIKALEDQLIGTRYGIAYADATEKVIQLNRPAENRLMEQIEFLTSMLYSQLGLTQTIFDGTADEKTTINYYNRTVEPVLSAIADGLSRRFITKTGRSQGQAIGYLRNPFNLVPLKDLGTIADSFTRNAILSSNEIRSIIGYKPSDQPEADELRNKNLNPPNPENSESKESSTNSESENKEKGVQ